MLEKIKELADKMRANIEHRGALAAVLEDIGAGLDEVKSRIEGLGHEATGETGAAVAALGDRLDSLTMAVNSIGSRLDSIGSRLDSMGSLVLSDGTVKSLSERLVALEAKQAAPAPALVPPYDPANAGQQSQQA